MNHNISIVKNFITTYLIKRHYFLMVLILPHLISKIGIDQFGTLEFSKSLCYYFTIFINFGFNYTSAQGVMMHKDNIKEISKIFSSTYLIKLMLSLLSVPILFACFYYIESLRNIKVIVLMFWLVAVASSLTPVFLYQGMNKMGHLVVIDGLCRILFVILLFLYIGSPKDAWLYPAIYAFIDFLRTGIAISWAFISLKVRFVLPEMSYVKEIYKPSSSMFLVTFSRTLYERFPQFVLGITMGRESVGLYVVGTRIIGEINMGIQQFMQAMYPNISSLMQKNHHAAMNLLKTVLVFSGSLVILSCFLCFTYATEIVHFLSAKSVNESAEILKIASFIPICVYIYNLLGNSVLVHFGKRKIFSYTLISISLIAAISCVLFNSSLNMKTIVVSILGFEFTTMVIIVALSLTFIKKSLLQFNN